MRRRRRKKGRDGKDKGASTISVNEVHWHPAVSIKGIGGSLPTKADSLGMIEASTIFRAQKYVLL